MTEEQKKNVVEAAQQYLGTPYERGTDEKKAKEAIDCSLLMQLAYKTVGIEIGRSSILQAAEKSGIEIIPKEDFSNLEIGDLIFSRSDRGFYYDELFDGRKLCIGHVVMYIGEGKIINSRKSKGGVIIEDLRTMIAENSNYEIVLVKRF
jgi:cell wall-associated NlpC family hydrolase